jgi:hypothetical protein
MDAPTQHQDSDAPKREMLSYRDSGTGRDHGRPRFHELVGTVRRTPPNADGKPPVIVVSELSRLFRNRADRAVVDELIAQRHADVVTARENIDTNTMEGRERYRAVADLLMLAYEGEPLVAATRAEVIDRYVEDVLDRWLELIGVPTEERTEPTADVRARLRALARRWGSREADVLLAAYREVADNHEPSELAPAVRELAVVGVRNSDLETLHLSDHIEQYDWRVITQAAAYALQALPGLPAGELDGDDPFAGAVDTYPTAAAAFAVLSRLEHGERERWTAPERPLPELSAEIAVVPMTREGADVLHAMDPRLPQRVAAALQRTSEQPPMFAVPSLKHISRNPHKLFGVCDYVLAHGGTLVTANVLVTPDEVVRREPLASYNDQNFAWSRLPVLFGAVKVGRNEPCPCGSGLKYKRCCGA